MYEVLTVKYVVKYNFAEFRTNHTATKIFFFSKDKSYSNETPKTNYTATKTFFLYKDKSYSNEAFFSFLGQIVQQRQHGEVRSVK